MSSSTVGSFIVIDPNQHVHNTFVDFPARAAMPVQKSQSDSELFTDSELQSTLHRRLRSRNRSPSPSQETFLPEEVPVDAACMGGEDDGSVRRRAKPGKKERQQMRQNKSAEPLKHDQACQGDPAPRSSPGTSRLCLTLVAICAAFCSITMLYLDRMDRQDRHRLQMAQAEREDEQNKILQDQNRHELALQKPATDLLRDAREVVGTPSGWSLTGSGNDRTVQANSIIAKLDYEKFQVSTGAWKFRCNVADVEASLRSKLGDDDNDTQGDEQHVSKTAPNKHLPKGVINNIIKSLQIDEEVVETKRNFVVDGGLGTSTSSQGHMYQVRLRSKLSGEKVSVALMVFLISFDMKKVVDHTETQEEPVYEFVQAPKTSTRKCTTRTIDGRQCVFPFEYRGERFLSCTTSRWSGLWCATSTYANDKMYDWEMCGPERCTEEEEHGPKFVKKFVRMAQKKFPIYSHRALPEGVTQTDLLEALDVVASQEAVKVLSN